MRLIPFFVFLELLGLVTPELHLKIRRMALHQYWIDVQEEGRQKCKLQDAKDYEKLQQAWGLGPIKLGQKDNLLEIKGIYVEDNRCKSVFFRSGKSS